MATAASSLPMTGWWRDRVVASVEHVRVIERVHDESGTTGRYVFMTLMSAGIAVLGLLLSSPAVVIGAMLISPLMGPIIGLGFGLALFDAAEIRRSVGALAIGVVVAVLFCAVVVRLSPLQNVTEEIAARTRPNLFDLMVALFSALAGAYAMIRGREGTVVGVAIATALMPPLAVIGYGLATLNQTVFFGSLLLFVTNLFTIAITAAIVARVYGFGQTLSPQQTVLQWILIIGTFAALAIPLGVALRQIAWEATASSTASSVVAETFGDDARVSQLDLDYAEPLRVSATVLTPVYVADADQRVRERLMRDLGRAVNVDIEQYRVGVGAAAAEQAAIAKAASPNITGGVATTAVVDRLSLVAGVDPGEVTVDAGNKRALVRAAALPGATLEAYRLLEARVARTQPGWQVQLIPPVAPLPAVSFAPPAPAADADGDPDASPTPPSPDAAGSQAIATAAWGAARLDVPIGVAGPAARVGVVVERLQAAGVRAIGVDGAGAEGGAVRLVWIAPDALQGLVPASGAAR